jgi:hypothetical protein
VGGEWYGFIFMGMRLLKKMATDSSIHDLLDMSDASCLLLPLWTVFDS